MCDACLSYAETGHLATDRIEIMKYFPLLYRLHVAERYLIWISNEPDSVAVDAGELVPTFENPIRLRQYANLRHYTLENEEPLLHDLGWITAWKLAPDALVDCQKALAAWNLFGDIAVSVPSRGTAFVKLKSDCFEIYDKLFWGNNLPAVTPEGERYIPEWSPDGLRSLDQILTTGRDLFVSCTYDWVPTA
jgi:hypothetical protein